MPCALTALLPQCSPCWWSLPPFKGWLLRRLPLLNPLREAVLPFRLLSAALPSPSHRAVPVANHLCAFPRRSPGAALFGALGPPVSSMSRAGPGTYGIWDRCLWNGWGSNGKASQHCGGLRSGLKEPNWEEHKKHSSQKDPDILYSRGSLCGQLQAKMTIFVWHAGVHSCDPWLPP